MLWYKAWLETRWPFLIGLVLLLVLACGNVLEYPRVSELMPGAPTGTLRGPIGRTVARAIEVQRTYRGFIWWQWVRQNLTQTWTFFAALLGAAGLFAGAGSGGTLFTLSLPVSRTRIAVVRAATALAELLVLAVVPTLVFPLLSPAIGQTYGFGDAVVHATCIFAGGVVFFFLGFLLSTVFADIWRPLLIACGVALSVAMIEAALPGTSRFGIFAAMTAETYFRAGSIPWPGLLASVGGSAALFYAAIVKFRQMDF